MRITGPDYTDEDLIAPWDPARSQPRHNRLCDDPSRDNPRDDIDDDDDDEPKPPAREATP